VSLCTIGWVRTMLLRNGGSRGESVNIVRFTAIAIGEEIKRAAHSISLGKLPDLNRACRLA
jgi:hypothetical protein